MGTLPIEPPEPPIVLRVGVTGHRHLDPHHAAPLRARIAAVLARIREGVVQAAESTTHRLVMVSPLAEGADQLVAEAGRELEYEIQCPFPFPVEEYREDFEKAPEARTRFDALCRVASSTLELDGRRERIRNADGRAESLSSASGYEQVGRVVLENCDVLLAIWDGEAARGRGGTGQIVKEASGMGIPIVVIPPAAPDGAYVLYGDLAYAARRVDLDQLDRRVREIVSPEDVGVEGPASRRDPAIAKHMETQRVLYRMYRDEDRRVATFEWQLARTWSRFWALMPFGFHGPKPSAADGGALPAYPPDTPGSESPERPSALASYFASHYHWTSALAGHYMRLYRASFVANFLLGALAVWLALAGGIAHLKHEHLTDKCPLPLFGTDRPETSGAGPPESVEENLTEHDAGPPIWTTARQLALLELLIILLILLVAFRARRGQWHRKAVDYRSLTEHLRTMRYLAPLGLGAPNTRPRPYVSTEGDLRTIWSNWEFRRILRAAGLVDARFTEDYRKASRDLIQGWATSQMAYHHQNAVRSERAHHLHERGALLCVYAALAACALHLVPAFDACSFLLTAAAAGFPALAAALHGIAGQAELERISKRSESMYRWLRSALTEGDLGALGCQETGAPSATAEIPSGVALQRAARSIASQMLDEVNDWQVLQRAGDIKAT